MAKNRKPTKFLSIICILVLIIGLLTPAVSAETLDTSPNFGGASGVDDNEDSDSSSAEQTPSSKGMSNATPFYDVAVQSGRKIRLQCSAPTGATVSVSINGKNYKLKEKSTSGKIGTFSGNYKIPASQKVEDLGKIKYTMTNAGASSSISSEGKLFSVGENVKLTVQVKNASATAFKDPRSRNSGFVTTLKKGAVDSVTSYYGNMYRLSTVGWVDASAVTPLPKSVTLNNKVSSVSFSKSSSGEVFTLNGNSHPPYTASHTGDKLTITFARTSGISSIDTSQSSLFSSATISTNSGATTITFNLKNSNTLWGYRVSYSGGKTTILCRTKPVLSDSDAPLTGLVIGVDPGHGGTDIGAPGFGAGGKGPVEKDINLSTATVLKASLEGLGAKVVMLRSGDTKATLSDRIHTAEDNNVDFVLSVHCNAAYNNTSNGVEVYYYEPIAKSLATNISANLSQATSRVNRGAKNSCYVVTLNSFAPSVLIEMGYMTNQNEYDALKSEDGINQAVSAIVESVVSELS